MQKSRSSKTALALAAGTALAVGSLLSVNASAATPVWQSAGDCMGTDAATEKAFTNPPAGTNAADVRHSNFIKNYTSSSITVVCPIVKQTSGPGVENDFLTDVDVSTSLGTNVSCSVIQWRSDIASLADSNWRVMEGLTTQTLNETLTIHFIDSSNYWWTNQTYSGTPPSWVYADLVCDLPPNTALKQYRPHEYGDVTTARIYSAASCRPDGGNETGPWRYPTNTNWGDSGGRVYFAGAGNGIKNIFKCPVPNGSSVEVDVLGSTLITHVGCSLDTPPLTAMTWPSVSSNTSTPFQVLPLAGQSSILIPATGSHFLYCGEDSLNNSGDGDGSLIGYRTVQPLSRSAPSAWTATAAHSGGADVPARALDTDTNTRFSTGYPQTTAGQYFQVDMKETKTIRQVVMTSNADFARSYAVYVSTNSATGPWTAVYAGAGAAPGVVSARFAAIAARWVRIEPGVSSSTQWWSIYDFNVYP